MFRIIKLATVRYHQYRIIFDITFYTDLYKIVQCSMTTWHRFLILSTYGGAGITCHHPLIRLANMFVFGPVQYSIIFVQNLTNWQRCLILSIERSPQLFLKYVFYGHVQIWEFVVQNHTRSILISCFPAILVTRGGSSN